MATAVNKSSSISAVDGAISDSGFAYHMCLTKAFDCFNYTTQPTCFQNCPYRFASDTADAPSADIRVTTVSTELVLKLLLCSVIFLPSALGNICIVGVVARTKRLHTTTNYFLVNLAIADLMIALFNIWPYAITHLNLMQDPSEAAGIIFCKFNRFSQILAVTSSTLTLTLIACDRFFGIVFAMKAHLSERHASVYLIGVWSASFAVALPMLIFNHRGMRIWSNHVEIWCDESFPGDSFLSKRAYYTVFVAVLFFIPAVVMTTAYLCIVRCLWTARAPGERVQGQPASRSAQNIMRRKVIIMLISILIVFYVCWSPIQISILYDLYRERIGDQKLPGWYSKFEFTAHILAYSNAGLYPLLFVGYNENFRRGFREMFSCQNQRSLRGFNRSSAHFSNSNAYDASKTVQSRVSQIGQGTRLLTLPVNENGGLKYTENLQEEIVASTAV